MNTTEEQLKEAEELLQDGRLNIAAARALTGLSRGELYNRMASGELPFVRDGRNRFIPRRALVRMMARRQVAAQQS